MAEASVNDAFIRLFQDFVDLCVLRSWPSDTTQPEEIKSVLSTAAYIEKFLIMLTEKHCINQFLTLLSHKDLSNRFIHKLKTDPPKYILKKIINSDAHVSLIDVAMKEFQIIFSEERLVKSLAEIMVESASEETLLRNMPTELPEHKVVEYRTKLLLHELGFVSDEDIVDELKNCNQQLINSLVKCMVEVSLNAKYKEYSNTIAKIEKAFIEVMSSREPSATFWGAFSKVEKPDLINICLKYDNICEKLLEALKDNSNLLTNEPNKAIFILNEFVATCQIFCKNDILKLKFTDYLKTHNFDVSEWGFLSAP